MLTVRGLSPLTTLRLAAPQQRSLPRPLHVLICVADHFEPQRGPVVPAVARERVHRWLREYPQLALPLADSRGRPPQHTFFFPAEEYDPEHVEPLAVLCRQGLGDVEVHLHHDRDTSDGLREQLCRFTTALHDAHGLLQKDATGRLTYGFIHGNWALDNSRPDGRWCGVNDELSILMETGCYADFTMPSAPAGCQTSTINSIYYAQDDPRRPKSHDRGIRAQVGKPPPDDSLLMIQGPLALDWQRRKYGLLPSIENGDLTGLRPPTLDRLWNWLAAGVHVAGQPNWRFVKPHTHGAWEANTGMLLGQPMRAFHAALRDYASRQDWFHYYYVTAREMAGLVGLLAAGPRRESPAAALDELASRARTPLVVPVAAQRVMASPGTSAIIGGSSPKPGEGAARRELV